jgi:hypothetical protein
MRRGFFISHAVNRMNQPAPHNPTCPVAAPIRCKKAPTPLAPICIEPMTIDSARNPAMPWERAAIEVDSGRDEILLELAHGISVDGSAPPSAHDECHEQTKWRGARRSLNRLFALMSELPVTSAHTASLN